MLFSSFEIIIIIIIARASMASLLVVSCYIFLFISMDTDWGIGIKTHFWNPKQMYFNLTKIIFEVQVPFNNVDETWLSFDIIIHTQEKNIYRHLQGMSELITKQAYQDENVVFLIFSSRLILLYFYV